VTLTKPVEAEDCINQSANCHLLSAPINNVGSVEEVSMKDLVRVIGKVTGRTPRVHEIPEITQDTYRLVADISKVKSLGYRPTVSLEEGIRTIVEDLGESPELPSGGTIFAQGQYAEEAV
jgi:UDP-glucose 4-epimerase